MKRIHTALIALAAALAPLAAAQAAPMRYTFYDCGAAIDCSGEQTVLMQFTTSGVMQAPAVPPAGTWTQAESVDVTGKLAGDWDALGIATFNTNNAIGGMFIVNNLDAANDREFGPVMAIGAAVRSALRLDWGVGSYLGLGYVNCYNLDCSRQTTIRGYAKLMAEIWTDDSTGTVPEPGALGLALAALGLGALARKRRA